MVPSLWGGATHTVTTVGVLLPLLLGLALAYGFEGWQPDLLPGDHSVAGALFMGTAMFTTGVLMALITTAMVGPLLARLGYGRVASAPPALL
jgi:predicted RND superfamily exporter protein